MRIDCVLQRYGCNEQVSSMNRIIFYLVFFFVQFLRGDREQHYLSSNHQKAVLDAFDQITKQFTEQWRTQSTALESTMELETSDVLPKITTATNDKMTDDLRNLKDTIGVLSHGVQSLNDELISVNNESVQQSQSLEETEKSLLSIKTSIEESNNLLTAISTNIQILQQDLTILKQKYEDQRISSYDGVLVWKISRFNEKMGTTVQ